MANANILISFIRSNGGLVGSTFVLGIATSFAAPFLSKWGTEHLGLSPTLFGYFMTATALAGMAVNTLLARLSDAWLTRRRALAMAAASGIAGFACYALLSHPLPLLAAGCSFHALASACFAQLFSHVREQFNDEGDSSANASFRISIVRVCFSFAWTLGPAVGAVLLIQFGYRGLFLAAAALYALFLVGILVFLPSEPRPRPRSSKELPPLWETLKQAKVALSALAFAAAFAANAINMLNLPLALTRSLGGRESDLGIVFGIGPLAEIPLMLWFGHLSGRGHTVKLIKFGFLITCLYYCGLFMASEPWHVYLLQILSGASFAILTNVAIIYFQDLCPEQLGLATALFSNANAFGAIIGMLAFGYLVESLGNRYTFAACAAISAAAFLTAATFKEKKP